VGRVGAVIHVDPPVRCWCGHCVAKVDLIRISVEKSWTN
jgi:hypothetical protein